MSSCERPLKRSARDTVPSSVSKRYSLSMRTQGSSRRSPASSAPRQRLLFLQQLQPGRKPLFTCSGLMIGHGFSPLLHPFMAQSFHEDTTRSSLFLVVRLFDPILGELSDECSRRLVRRPCNLLMTCPPMPLRGSHSGAQVP